MTAEIIDGKAFAAGLRARSPSGSRRSAAAHGVMPGLAVVLVGDDPASAVYVRNKGRATVEAGMRSEEHRLDAATPEAELLAVDRTAEPRSGACTASWCSCRCRRRSTRSRVLDAVAPEKDVDGFHIANAGRLATGRQGDGALHAARRLMLLRDRLGASPGARRWWSGARTSSGGRWRSC